GRPGRGGPAGDGDRQGAERHDGRPLVREQDAPEHQEPGKGPAMSADLVTIRDLRVRLGGNDVLKGVDADLVRGSITALIGLNGSGKSTLLRALVKEVRPHAGRIEFH